MYVPVQSFDLLALFLIPLIESWCHVTTLGHVKTQFFQDDLHFSHQLCSYMDVQNINKPRTVAIERDKATYQRHPSIQEAGSLPVMKT